MSYLAAFLIICLTTLAWVQSPMWMALLPFVLTLERAHE